MVVLYNILGPYYFRLLTMLISHQETQPNYYSLKQHIVTSINYFTNYHKEAQLDKLSMFLNDTLSCLMANEIKQEMKLALPLKVGQNLDIWTMH